MKRVNVEIVRWPSDLWAGRQPEYSVFASSARDRGVKPVVSRVRGRRAAVRAAEQVVTVLSKRGFNVVRRFNHFA